MTAEQIMLISYVPHTCAVTDILHLQVYGLGTQMQSGYAVWDTVATE